MSSSSPSPLRLPAAFHRLAWSNLTAQSAEQIGLAATPLVAVLALGAGIGEIGLLQTAQTLPFLLLSLPFGVLADRSSRHRLMASAEAVRAAALLSVLALAALGVLSVAALALLGFVGAAGTVAYSVAAPALVPTLVPRAALATANGRIELARSLAFAGGPALGGALVGWTGAVPAFALAAALSATAACLLAGLAETPRPAAPVRHPLAELREGTAFVVMHPLLRPILLTAVFFNIGFFTLQSVYIPYAVHSLGFTATEVGATLAAYGIGMIVGALAAPGLSRRLPLGTLIAIGPLSGLAGALIMAATVWLPSPTLAFASYFLLGGGPLLWTISTMTLRQAATPGAMLGRASAVITTATWGARPLGAALVGIAGSTHGAGICLALACLFFVIQAAIILTSPVARLIELPAACPAGA